MSQSLSDVVYKLQNGPAETLLAAVKAVIQIPEDDFFEDLQPVIFSGFKLQNAALIQVINAIRELNYQDKFETLILQDVELSNHELEKLFGAIAQGGMTRLETVGLARNGLTPEYMPALLKLVRFPRKLVNLDLSHNKIGSVTALDLCKTVQGYLDLSFNPLDSDFATNLIALIEQDRLGCLEVNLVGSMSNEDIDRVEQALIAIWIHPRMVLHYDFDRQKQLDDKRKERRFKSDPDRVGVFTTLDSDHLVQSILDFAALHPELAERAIQNIRLHLGRKPKEISLRLRNLRIGDPGDQILAQVLENNPTLESLEIWDPELSSETFTVLLEALKKNTRLNSLVLNVKPLRFDLLNVLIAALPALNIKTLDIPAAGMTNTNFALVAAALSHNRQLQTLKCPNFKPANVGLDALLLTLASNFALRVVKTAKPVEEAEPVHAAVTERLNRNKNLDKLTDLQRYIAIRQLDPQAPNPFPSLEILAQKAVDQEKARVAAEVAKFFAECDRKLREKQLQEFRTACETDPNSALKMMDNEFIRFRGNELEEPLKIACQLNHTQIVLLAIKHGAPVNTQDADGHSPLWWAYRHGNQEVIRDLWRRGATPLTQEQIASAVPPKPQPAPSTVPPMQKPAVSTEPPVKTPESEASAELPEPTPLKQTNLKREAPPKPECALSSAIKTATEKYLQYHSATKAEKKSNKTFNRGHGDGWFSGLRHGKSGVMEAQALSKSALVYAGNFADLNKSVEFSLKKSGVHRHSLSSYLMDEMRRQNRSAVKDRYTRQECLDALNSYKPSR